MGEQTWQDRLYWEVQAIIVWLEEFKWNYEIVTCPSCGNRHFCKDRNHVYDEYEWEDDGCPRCMPE